jgi:quinol monooxygenase YgiN
MPARVKGVPDRSRGRDRKEGERDVIYEVATIEVIAGQEQAFEAAVAQAAPHFRKSKGCRSLALHRGIERPSVYKLVVGWDTVDDHMVTFRNSPEFQEWRRLASPFFASPPQVEHQAVALSAF